jgi:Flp pilus assembly protein TadD
MNTTNDKNKNTPRIITVKSKPDGSVEMIELGNSDNALKYAADLISKGQFTNGINLLKILATLRPKDPEVLQELAHALIGVHQPKDALLYAQKLMQISPNCAISVSLLGMCYSSLGNTSEASKALEKAFIAEFTGIESFRFVVALAMLLEEQIPEAEKLVQKIHEMEPDDQFGWVALGNIFRTQGKISEAKGAFNRAILIAPASDLGELALQLLVELKTNQTSDPSKN